MFLPHPRVKVSIVGSLRDREVACSASDRQCSNFESCVWGKVSSQSAHHPQDVLRAQFSLYVHKGHFISFHSVCLCIADFKLATVLESELRCTDWRADVWHTDSSFSQMRTGGDDRRWATSTSAVFSSIICCPTPRATRPIKTEGNAIPEPHQKPRLCYGFIPLPLEKMTKIHPFIWLPCREQCAAPPSACHCGVWAWCRFAPSFVLIFHNDGRCGCSPGLYQYIY